MAIPRPTSPKFLGRTMFDVKTQMYHFEDGSGRVPVEMEYDIDLACATPWPNGLKVLATLFAWKARLNALQKSNQSRE